MVRGLSQMPDDEGAELLQQAKNGDTQAFEELLRRHLPGARRLALALTRNAADADDLAQESFLKAWRALPGFEGRSSFRTWLHRIIVNRFKDRQRSEAAKPTSALDAEAEDGESAAMRVPDPAPGPAELAEASDAAGRAKSLLRSLLSRLPPVYRVLVILRELHELDYESILDFVEAVLAAPGDQKALPFQEGLSLDQLRQLHEEVCPRHAADAKTKKLKTQALYLRVHRAIEALAQAGADSGIQP